MSVQSVSGTISALADSPVPVARASLHRIAALVARMEEALDEQVANAVAEAHALDRGQRRGRFDVVRGGRHG